MTADEYTRRRRDLERRASMEAGSATGELREPMPPAPEDDLQPCR